MNISSKHSSSNFAHSFDSHCLFSFAKNINLSYMLSIWRKLLCKLSIYTLKSDEWITIWWSKFELECLLLIFTYSNSQFKVTCKNADSEYRYSEFIQKKTLSKFSHITFAILSFSNKNALIAILSILESTSLNKTIRCASKCFILTQRIPKSRLCRESQVCNLRTHNQILSLVFWRLCPWFVRASHIILVWSATKMAMTITCQNILIIPRKKITEGIATTHCLLYKVTGRCVSRVVVASLPTSWFVPTRTNWK